MAHRIGGFPIAPGTICSSKCGILPSTSGHAYLVNYNNNQSVTISFIAPAGTSWRQLGRVGCGASQRGGN